MTLKVGATARLVQPEIQGVVVERRISGADDLELLVEWTENGQAVQRWFDANLLEEVPQ